MAGKNTFLYNLAVIFHSLKIAINRCKGKLKDPFSTLVSTPSHKISRITKLNVLLQVWEIFQSCFWLFIVDIVNVLTHLQHQFKNKMDSASPSEVNFQCFLPDFIAIFSCFCCQSKRSTRLFIICLIIRYLNVQQNIPLK